MLLLCMVSWVYFTHELIREKILNVLSKEHDVGHIGHSSMQQGEGKKHLKSCKYI